MKQITIKLMMFNEVIKYWNKYKKIAFLEYLISAITLANNILNK